MYGPTGFVQRLKPEVTLLHLLVVSWVPHVRHPLGATPLEVSSLAFIGLHEPSVSLMKGTRSGSST